MQDSERLRELRDRLRKLCPMGATVYTFEGKHCGHVFLCVANVANGKAEIATITGPACTVTGRKWCPKCGGMVKTSCFDAVYELGRALYPNGGPIEFGRNATLCLDGVDGTEPDGGYLLHNCLL